MRRHLVAVFLLCAGSVFEGGSAEEDASFEGGGTELEVGDESGDNTPAGDASGSDTDLLKHLVISGDSERPFGNVDESRSGDSEGLLFSGGKVLSPFRCGIADSRAVELASMSARRLTLGWQEEESGYFDNMWGSDDDFGPSSLRVSNVLVSVVAAEGEPVMAVALEPALPAGIFLRVASGESGDEQLNIVYDCFQDGQATVELQFKVYGESEAVGTDVCLQWTKICTLGWGNLEIRQGDELVFVDGQVQEEWSKRMLDDGAHDSRTRFELSADGLERLRVPTATSNQKLVKLDVSGHFLFEEGVFEVTSDPVPVTILYTCEYDGFAEITLVLEKERLWSGHSPERFELKWKKQCGVLEYRFLQVFIKSENYKNKTQAVEKGLVLPNFMRPCKGPEKSNSGACAAQGSLLEIPIEDTRTSVEMLVLPGLEGGSLNPPTFQPQPEISFNRRILSASIIMPRPQTPKVSKSHLSSSVARPQFLTVKYVCFREGTSMVMVTLHVLAHKPIEIVWRKRCVEPKPHVGKALTAPQAMVLTIFICGLIAAIAFCCFGIKGDDEDSPPARRGAGRRRDVDMEMPRPNKVGISSGHSAEVTLE